ncbi:hypothetical protein Poli38472_000396 [Pythium oligandrum]|uniref:IQCH-like ATP-grasp domain-containing protein n=1 Tax=Pythium oligandrum TaxID=41045 RepID=A0A8K1CBK3_PYTOL|nr:hypothetical protein Poli38472_000396 [Pythium oligandrum]|eukprot:TMW60354.1 hypothetical protein Poli38472_000396 [Pythium oligandrum]
MEQLQQQHHVEDVGRILLQTQEQLRLLREELAVQQTKQTLNGGRSSSPAKSTSASEIEEILQRAENELRLKAELVLNNILTQPTSPTGRAVKQPVPSSGLLSLPALDASVSPLRRRRKRYTTTNESTEDADPYDLQYFRQRFPNNTTSNVDSLNAALRRRGGGLPTPQRGKVVKHKTATHTRLLPSVNKYDPTAPRPLLSPVDATQGVLSLLNRGFLPPHVDLTPAFQGSAASDPTPSSSSVLKNASVRLHHRQDQPIRSTPYSLPAGIYNLATLKFDMRTALPEPVKEGANEDEGGEEDEARDTYDDATSSSVRLKTVRLRFPSSASSFSEGKRSVRTGRSTTRASNQDTERSSVGTRCSLEDDEEDGSKHTPSSSTHREPAADGDDANSMEELRKNVDKIRGYNELLDTYSLHQFIIHKGRAMRETPEFQSFQRIGQQVWGSVEAVITALETLLTRYFVPLAYIDGQRLLTLASMELSSFTKHELLSCVVNEDQVASLIRRPGQRYKGKDRKRRAAVTLQAFFRMLSHRMRFLKVRRHGASAMRIQKTWRTYACQQATRRKLEAKRGERMASWQSQMARFRIHWHELKTQRRVLIHVPSFSIDERVRLRAENFLIQENLQLSRLGGLIDSNVELIYVLPFELTEEVTQYIFKLLQLGGVSNASSRVKLVVPEHARQFPAHFSLASLILYSPHCLRRIQRLIKGKEAYLVMGMPGPEDQRLALTLQVPLLSLEEPQRALPLMTRSGTKRVCIKAEVNTPMGTYDLYDLDEVLFALAKLIISHLDHNTWLLRLDYDPFGKGTASIDVSTLQTLRDIRREKKAPEYWRQPGIRDAIARTLLHELEREISTLAVLIHPEVFPNWPMYVEAIQQYGVVIEALPAVVRGVLRANLFIEPSGDLHVMSTQDVVSLAQGGSSSQRRRRPLAFAFPQTLAPYDAVRGAALAIARQLHDELGFLGYASVDMQLYEDDTISTKPERLNVVALHPYLTDSASTFALFHLLQRGVVHPSTGLYHLTAAAPTSLTNSASSMAELVVQDARLSGLPSLERVGAARSYVSVDYVFHPNVSTVPYRAFFHTCRLHGVCFDVQRGVGTVFALCDSLTAGVFGVVSMGESALQSLQYLRTALEVVAREVGTNPLGSSLLDSDDSVHNGNFAELLTIVRHVLQFEKAQAKARATEQAERLREQQQTEANAANATRKTSLGNNSSKVDRLRRLRRVSQM